jgi:Trm5-related predicted tRNA methylase
VSTYSACRDGTCYRVGCGTCNDRRRIRARNDAITLPARINELAMQHGSIRAAARVVKIDHAYLWRLARGTKKEPSAAVLKKLGVRRIVTYQPITPLPFDPPDLSICEQHEGER